MSEGYDRKFVPVHEIRADKLSYEQILMRRIDKIDAVSEKYAHSLENGELREFRTALQNFYGFILPLGSKKDTDELHSRILPLRLKLKKLWGSKSVPRKANRQKCFELMDDLWNVLRAYALTQGRIVPTQEMALLVGQGTFRDEDLMEKIQEIEAFHPEKSPQYWDRYERKKQEEGD